MADKAKPTQEKVDAKPEAAEGKAAKGKANGSKAGLMVIIAVVVAVSALIGGKVVISGHKTSAKKTESTDQVGAKVQLEEFLVNLSGNDHYLRATLSLGLKKGLTEESVKDDTAPIRDAINSVLSSKKVDELTTEEGKERLKGEIKDRVNHELGNDKVARVYFTAFATQ